jgi:hypothetical protein
MGDYSFIPFPEERYIKSIPPAVLSEATRIAKTNDRFLDFYEMSALPPGVRTYNSERDHAGLAVNTYRGLLEYYWNYLNNPFTLASGILPHPGPLNAESKLIIPDLLAIMRKGYLTLDSQPGALVFDREQGTYIQCPYLFIITPFGFYDQICACIDANLYISRINYPDTPEDLDNFPSIPDAIKSGCRRICIGVRNIHVLNYNLSNSIVPGNIGEYLEFILSNQNFFFTKVNECLPDITAQIGGRHFRHQKRKQYKTRHLRHRKCKQCKTRRSRRS